MVTPSPTLSTTPPPSWPRIQGKRPSVSAPLRAWSSVWHTPLARICRGHNTTVRGKHRHTPLAPPPGSYHTSCPTHRVLSHPLVHDPPTEPTPTSQATTCCVCFRTSTLPATLHMSCGSTCTHTCTHTRTHNTCVHLHSCTGLAEAVNSSAVATEPATGWLERAPSLLR